MNFRVEPEVCLVDCPAEVRVTATLDGPLEANARIAFAPPESWSSQPYCVTFTKEPQTTDPDQADYVSIHTPGAWIETSIEQIVLPAGSPKGHVRKIVGTVREGRVPAGGEVVLWLHNYRSTWLAEKATFRVWLGDDEIVADDLGGGAPTIWTMPDQADRLRVIVPSCARPGEPFRVQIVSYDRFWNRSSSTYRDGVLQVEGGAILEQGIAFTGSWVTQTSLSECGVFRLRYGGALSNPIRVTENPRGPLIEIYSSHGLSEAFWPEHALSCEFNRTRGLENKHATSLDRPVYARDAWQQGRRYGVIASSDDHMGQAGKPIKGLAAVFSPENTREGIWQGLKTRRCYGATGERILLDFRVNGHEMGEEVFVDGAEPLCIEIEVHGTDEIGFVEIARLRFDEGTWESAFLDRQMVLDPFAEAGTVDPMDFKVRFEELFVSDALYYLRVGQRKQVDNYPVFAWSSPIWVTKRPSRGGMGQ